jgi:SseB protein N-terminal domain
VTGTEPRKTADSAGVPWAGRTLTPQPFAADDGSAHAPLARALAAGDLEQVAAALLTARVFVPVVAVLGDGPAPIGPHGRPVDKSSDMAVATLVAPDGRRALPVFSSAAALEDWDRTARPVPAEGPRAALSAVQDDCAALVVDPGAPHAIVLPRPALWAVAQGRRWVPPESDAGVADAVRAAVEGLTEVAGLRLVAGEGGALTVVLAVRPGLDAAELSALLDAVRDGLSRAEVLAERAESLTLTVVPA